ncbi:hypothetical protein HYI18_05815 [Clostridium botulinum]|uniref:hypothetical protein n=1 Tax=Clostridium TaxID=1485 RepID=UPI00090C58A1|nr:MULTISPECIES: hypothetical protein [Clostridium]APF28681.1 hypothetical protein NPD7_442 [Clostridium sporogenes]MBD5638109.1 hypothetical protein [Clostridium botulinum]MDI6919447.1 hypothetical protein [Clostridium botulinum]WMU96697.1 hypothetical protein QA656_13085 [Clostridium botulinum]
MVAFLLIVIGSILIFINFKAIKKEKGSFSETLKGSIENIDEYKEEIGLIRKEFAETLIDVQKEMEYLKKELNVLKHTYENNIETEDFYKKNHSTNYPKESEGNLLQPKYIDSRNAENISTEINKKNIQKDILTNDNDKNSSKDDNSIKVNEVSKFLEEGHAVEEICEILNMGKGEVILIKELYLK